ncbi:MAG: ABC transporter substrate-binding protein [Chloroflexi bacterium]|nr:ABC transporter substrate-binding protein [Chloroflexota bacterium]
MTAPIEGKTARDAIMRSRGNRRKLLQRAVGLGLSGPVLGGLPALRYFPVSAQEGADGEWVVALTEEPTGFDAPATTYTFSNVMVETHILEPLVDIQGPELEVTPLLAESWEIVDDTTWQFTLREGVTWHNGAPFTAADVKWTLDRMADGPRAYMISQFESVETPDDTTVVITTKGPFGAMIAQLTDLVILPQQAWEEMGGEAFNAAPIGTGPYRMAEWRRGEAVVLEANPDWWRGTPTPERLVFRPIVDPATRVAELRSGGVDIIQSVPAAELEALNAGDTRVVNIPQGRLMIYPFNMAEPPFDDVRVRQALHYGTDRAEIVDALLGEYGTLLTGPFTSIWLGFNPEVEAYPYDPEKARQLLAEAGQENLEFTWNITDGVFIGDREVAEALANQLRQIGVTMNLQVTERAKLQEDHQAGNFQLTSVAWGTRTDPDPMLQSIVASRAHNTDEVVKALIQQAREEVDEDVRAELYQQIHARMAEQAEWLFVYAQAETFGARADVPWNGVPTHGSLAINLFYLLEP